MMIEPPNIMGEMYDAIVKYPGEALENQTRRFYSVLGRMQGEEHDIPQADILSDEFTADIQGIHPEDIGKLPLTVAYQRNRQLFEYVYGELTYDIDNPFNQEVLEEARKDLLKILNKVDSHDRTFLDYIHEANDRGLYDQIIGYGGVLAFYAGANNGNRNNNGNNNNGNNNNRSIGSNAPSNNNRSNSNNDRQEGGRRRRRKSVRRRVTRKKTASKRRRTTRKH